MNIFGLHSRLNEQWSRAEFYLDILVRSCGFSQTNTHNSSLRIYIESILNLV